MMKMILVATATSKEWKNLSCPTGVQVKKLIENCFLIGPDVDMRECSVI